MKQPNHNPKPFVNTIVFANRFRFLVFWLLLAAVCVAQTITQSQSQEESDVEEEYIAYSLKNAFEQASLYASLPDAADPLLYHFGGITQLDGFVIDTLNQDILLVGMKTQQGYALHLDDWVEVLNNALDSTFSPFCSIDPIPNEIHLVRKILEKPILANDELQFLTEMKERLAQIKSVWKTQKVRIGGIGRESHHAHLMVDADYLLKKNTHGLVHFEGLDSYLERMLNPEAYGISIIEAANTVNSVRFWFHIQSFNPIDSARVPFPHFERSEFVVQLLDCPVVLLTEKQIYDVFGVAHPDSNKTDPFAEAYAVDFSNQWDAIQQKEEKFAALEELFKLNALVRAMVFVGAFEQVNFPIRSIQHEYVPLKRKPMPETLPALVNHQSTLVEAKDQFGELYNVLQFPIVYGGIDMSFPMTEKQFFRRKNQALDSLKNKCIQARPDSDAVYWKVNSNTYYKK
ncbi:MAG: hypothetical protein N2450_07825 [bacterium]|nr:hypothetical protein [bacterium]